MKNGEVFPDIYNLRKMSIAFNISSDYIIGLTNEIESNYEATDVVRLFENYRNTLKNSINEEDYYWIKIEVDDNKDYIKLMQTKWAGFDENENEIRKPREVIPENVIKICKQLNEPVAIINKISEIALLYIFGGNALIRKDLYEEHMA